MSERYVFPLRYDESDMKRAVDAFVWRALFKEKRRRARSRRWRSSRSPSSCSACPAKARSPRFSWRS